MIAAATLPGLVKPAPPKAAAKPHLVAAAKPRQHEAEPAAIAQLPAPATPPLARPYYAPVMPAYSPAPLVIHAPSVQTASVSAPSAQPFVGSALGMARSLLAAPVPVASAATLGSLSGR